ncbi:MAG: hypothetical protein AB7E47_11610 [Desulfovibrionaceae bacterium]
MSKTYRDMGKVSLFVSLLSVLLVVIFFFGLNQNITGVSAKVKELAAVSGQLEQVNGKLTALEERVATFDALPQKAKRMMYATMLLELAQRVANLSATADSEEQATKLAEAMKLIQEVQAQYDAP